MTKFDNIEEDTLIGVCVGIIISLVIATPLFGMLAVASVVSTLIS